MDSLKRFAIIIPSYKNANYYEKNLKSVLSQNYNNFHVIYTDDCSPDGTADLVQKFLEENDHKKLVNLFRNEQRVGALENLYNMIHSCDDDDIIITLDGDDWFAHDNVLNVLNENYNNNDIWVTYGQYKSYPDMRIGCSREIPEHVKQQGSYRRYRWCSSHLRSFYTWLFKKIKKEDLLDEKGNFYSMAWDLSIMFPMLEMAGFRHKFISDVLYIYNYETPINDAKVNLQLQQNLERKFRAMKSYQKLELK